MKRALLRILLALCIVPAQAQNHSTEDSDSIDLANELAKPEQNQKNMVEGFVPMPIQLMNDCAFVTNVPFSDYFSLGYGFGLGFGVAYKKIMIGCNFGATFGKWKKHVDDPQGVIGKDALLVTSNLTGYLGCNVYDGRKLSITPFIGLGERGVSGGEMYEEYRENNKNNEVSYGVKHEGFPEKKKDKKKELSYDGFSFGVGMMFDFKFWRAIDRMKGRMDFEAGENGIVETPEKSIRVKPYLSFTRYGNGIGWAPALNVSVGVHFRAFWMTKNR